MDSAASAELMLKTLPPLHVLARKSYNASAASGCNVSSHWRFSVCRYDLTDPLWNLGKVEERSHADAHEGLGWLESTYPIRSSLILRVSRYTLPTWITGKTLKYSDWASHFIDRQLFSALIIPIEEQNF